MTRAEISKVFPTATEEQITALLNQHNFELQVEKDKTKDLKGNADKVKELEAQLEELNNRDLPDIDKLQKQIEKVQGDYEKAQQTIKNMELKSSLQEQGLSSEDADNFIQSMNSDKFDASVLGTIIKNAVSAKEKELMDDAPNPVGNNGATDTKSDAEKLAATLHGDSSNKTNVLEHYI